MWARTCYLILYFCIFSMESGFAQSQGIGALTKLESTYITHFSQEDIPYSNTCFTNAILDQKGRLWLNVCGDDLVLNSTGLFLFDGYRFQPIESISSERSLLENTMLFGIDGQGRLFGRTELTKLFIMDPNTRQLKIIPPADPAFDDLIVRNVMQVGGRMYVMGSTEEHSLHLFYLQDELLERIQSFDYSNGYWKGGKFPLVIDSSEIWMMGATLPLFRFDPTSKTTRAFYAEDFIGQELPGKLAKEDVAKRPSTLIKNASGAIYLFLPEHYGNNLFWFDREKDHFKTINHQFPADWTPANIFKDQVGNVCFLFKDPSENYRAILLDVQGQWFDYSNILKGQQRVNGLAGRDFRRQVFLMGENGLYSVGIRSKETIRQALKNKWISSMAPLPDGRLLVNTVDEGWFVYVENAGMATPFQGPDCHLELSPFSKGMKQQIIQDKDGNLYFISIDKLVKYHPETHACQVYDLGQKIFLFGLAKEGLVVLQNQRAGITFFDLEAKKYISFGEGVIENLNGFIRDIFVDSKGIIWVPTNDGLWRIDLEKEQSKVYGLEDGFADLRFTSIYEDSDEKLWLGTYFGGLHIFDPKNDMVTIIDRDQGLSHNAVMSIIPDSDGDLWVSTEKGINIVSKKGEVIYKIFQEDGLVFDKFERFDPLRTEDGRLFFGSRKGISIIDPGKLKAAFRDREELKIYLTELVYFDKKKGKNIVIKNQLKLSETIKISAEHPNIQLKFGLSSYQEPQKNRFAYILEGIEKEWNYLGSKPELNINHLPPGKYRLLVRGADFRNQWVENPLEINIHAKDFFYKQVWFYLLASLPFIVFALIWARNKQLETRRLEREVDQRTQKIKEDKEVIEQQALELQQLNEIKSRFFTNISHELRTPITLITAPLQHVIQKHGGFLNKKVRHSLDLVLRNASKLGSLVEQLLELSSLDAQKAQLKEVPTPLSPFCLQLFNIYDSGAALKNIDYQFHSNLKDDSYFLIDRNRLEKIINNLISNALKFTPPNGFIHMDLNCEKEMIVIKVMDSGRGIPPEDLPHIFERYFQTRRKDIATEGGTGIGLALSKELAHLMKGDLRVESKWGKGACFTLSFPAKAAKPENEISTLPAAIYTANPKEEEIYGPGPIVQSGEEATKTKLMVVEDNRDLQQVIQTLLADKYDCILADNGAEAWALLNEKNQEMDDVELILSDVMMPEMDGYTLLEKIKKHKHWHKLPIVMLTARATEEDKLQALRMGVDDYLLKPFSPEELRARLTNLIANYRVRKQINEQESKSNNRINVEFEPAISADSAWLKEVEAAAKEALEKGVKLTAAFLADKLFLSERQFSRKLKGITGLTPNGYSQEVKLQKARYLLENKVYSTINEVAHASGYSSASYLAKAYQERFGKKPGDY